MSWKFASLNIKFFDIFIEHDVQGKKRKSFFLVSEIFGVKSVEFLLYLAYVNNIPFFILLSDSYRNF